MFIIFIIVTICILLRRRTGSNAQQMLTDQGTVHHFNQVYKKIVDPSTRGDMTEQWLELTFCKEKVAGLPL